MELRQRLTRWQNRMRNFRWGRRTNKQLLTVPNSDGDADNGRGVSTKKSRKNHTDVSAVDKSSSSSRPRYPIRWIKRSANSERLVDSDGTTSLSTSQDTIVNRTVQSVLSTNGLKAPRYAKLTSSATQENNHQSNSTEQSKIKLVPEKWNELTSVLRSSKRLKSSNNTRLKSSGDAVLNEEEEDEDDYQKKELHTYAFDNAALDMQNLMPEYSVTV